MYIQIKKFFSILLITEKMKCECSIKYEPVSHTDKYLYRNMCVSKKNVKNKENKLKLCI